MVISVGAEAMTAGSAKMALLTLLLDPAVAPLDRVVRDKHFFRKHGPGAYYGQTGHGQAAPA